MVSRPCTIELTASLDSLCFDAISLRDLTTLAHLKAKLAEPSMSAKIEAGSMFDGCSPWGMIRPQAGGYSPGYAIRDFSCREQ